MLYGCSPFADQSAEQLGLQPAMTLTSEVIATQHLQPGERVGYGFSYEMVLATLTYQVSPNLVPLVFVAAVLWAAVSAGFSYYVTNFGNYNETYGSLGAVIGFMTWIWLSSTVVLVGAELDAEMEHQTARDTTAGPERPLGERGARMADEVAG